jgi:hypothetical protein
MLGNSCVAQRLAAFEEGLGSMELISVIVFSFSFLLKQHLFVHIVTTNW